MSQYGRYSGTGGSGGGSGTVTSVGLVAPGSILSVSGSPVTVSGNLTLSLVTQSANTVWAGPTAGLAANPSFRLLVASDIPALSYVSSVGVTAPITTTGGLTPTIGITQSSGISDGYLSSVDWNTFNNKQPAGNYITALTNDVTAAGPGSVPSTLIVSPHKRYVDFVLGDDTTGTGSVVRPWKTIQHAMNSISPTINEPYTLFLSGGNNDTDVGVITAKPNVSLFAEYPIQIGTVGNPYTITGGATNDGCTFTNIIFVGGFSWIRNDATGISVSLLNTLNFGNFVLKQTGSGSAGVISENSVIVNGDFATGPTGSFFMGTTFLGTSCVFEDATSAAYYQFLGGYSATPMSFSGGIEAYFAGFAVDVPFGASVTAITTANGTPLFQIDSAGLPPTITGAASYNLTSYSQYIDHTAGVLAGDKGAPSATNVLLQVKDGHIKSTQTVAPTTTTSANAGTGASSSVSNATDSAGRLTLTVGTGAFSAGTQCTVNFNKAYNVAPIVVISPANQNAAQDSASLHQIYVTSTTAGFSINFGLQPNSSGNVYIWNYMVMETQ